MILDFIKNHWEAVLTVIGLISSLGLFTYFRNKFKFSRDEKAIIDVLERTTKPKGQWDYRSTENLASDANLTDERVVEVASKSKKIRRSKGENKNMWQLI